MEEEKKTEKSNNKTHKKIEHGGENYYHARVVTKLFSVVADACKDRQGGYCRIVKLGQRMTDSAPMALIEIIDLPQLTAPVAPSVTTGTASSPEVTAPDTEEAPAEAQK